MKFRALAVALTLFVAPTIGAAPVAAAPAATSPPSPSLSALFHKAADAFWSVEPRFSSYDLPFTQLTPLPPGDAAIPRYQSAARAAEEFLAAQKASQTPSEGTPVMLYFAAMSYDRLGDHARTLVYLDRLLREFPDYKRPRIDGDPFFDHSPRAELLLLRMWHARQLHSQPDTLESLGQMARDAAEIQKLLKTRERLAQKMPDLDYVARTADMLRAAALPGAVQLTKDAHDAALPQLSKQKGARATRDYLRGLNRKPLAPYFGDYANAKLVELDKVILAGYRNDAKKALGENRYDVAASIYRKMLADYAGTPLADEANAGVRSATIGGYRYAAQEAFKANDFDKARANWRQISAQFAGSSEAEQAQSELKKIVPVAVKFYRDEADKSFQPSRQIGQPQSRAREFYEKMYREDPDGAGADYAFLRWSRALGTEGKIDQAQKQLAQMDQKFPQSELRAQSLYARAFLAGSPKLRNYGEAVKLLQTVVQEYPQSSRAPEALWHIAFWSAPLGRYAQGIAALEQLQRDYPGSPRTPFAPRQIEQLRAKMAGGRS